jgi:hypothetical protein
VDLEAFLIAMFRLVAAHLAMKWGASVGSIGAAGRFDSPTPMR